MGGTPKHPHVRGEDDWERRNCWNRRETPPRAWGRLVKSFSLFFVAQKHPHVRGEDEYLYKEASGQRETPPRAWGRRIGNLRGSHKSRNTPTCVGKTLPNLSPEALRQKHPHVRGEDRAAADEAERTRETPPRAWGRPERLKSFEGITQKHPHVRGEDTNKKRSFMFDVETPPRAWGRRLPPLAPTLVRRNTPTCVGKTWL